MALITDQYRALNADMLHQHEFFGCEGHKFAPNVLSLARKLETKDILDYGAGKCTLKLALSQTDLDVRCYDPCIPELSSTPEPADLVVCSDVLEHIEPECLSEVLTHILSLAKRALYLVIAMAPAGKNLPDGTNPHRIIKPATWWHQTLEDHGIDVVRMSMTNGRKRYEFIARPRKHDRD